MAGHDLYITEFGRMAGVIQDRLQPLTYLERVHLLNDYDTVLGHIKEAINRGCSVNDVTASTDADRALIDTIVRAADVLGSDAPHLVPLIDSGQRYVHSLLMDSDGLQKPISKNSYSL